MAPNRSSFDSTRGAYGVRRATPDDVGQIAALYAAVEADNPIGPEEFVRVWRWLLESNPFGDSLILVGTGPAAEIAGHLALQPFPFVLDGRTVTAGGACQLMVAEEMRHSLLFPTLMRTALRQYTDVGMDFTFGLANKPRVLRAEQALGFRAAGALSVYARPYRTRPVGEAILHKPVLRAAARPFFPALDAVLRRFPVPGSNGTEVVQRESFPESVDALFHSTPDGARFRSLKNQSVLNWRFSATPRKYRILLAQSGNETLGYAVIRELPMRHLTALALVDLEFDDARPKIGAGLMRVVHDAAVESGVDVVACLMSPLDPRASLLKRCGYLPTPESFTLVLHTPDRGAPEGFHELQNWRLTWFEHDYA